MSTQNTNGTYSLIVNGMSIGQFGIIQPGHMRTGHVRKLRARNGVTERHKVFIDGSPADESTLIRPNMKVEFRTVAPA